jgi:hypothetical protein
VRRIWQIDRTLIHINVIFVKPGHGLSIPFTMTLVITDNIKNLSSTQNCHGATPADVLLEDP